MQGGLSFSTLLRPYFPFLVGDSMKQARKGRWGRRAGAAGGEGDSPAVGPLRSRVTGLAAAVGFSELVICFHL